jgi:hypothetical protein
MAVSNDIVSVLDFSQANLGILMNRKPIGNAQANFSILGEGKVFFLQLVKPFSGFIALFHKIIEVSCFVVMNCYEVILLLAFSLNLRQLSPVLFLSV